MADQLESFRRKGAAVSVVKASMAPADKEPYVAFGTKDKLGRFDIRTKDGLSHAPAYNYLLDVSYDRRAYTSVLLVLSFMLVRIRGRNLKPLVDAIKLHTCEFIAEFDPQDFEPPAEAEATLVESITIQTGRAATQREREPETQA
jgi:hypothetical protein